MNSDIVRGLLNNIILLLAAGIVCVTYSAKKPYTTLRRSLNGLVIGLAGSVVMLGAVEFSAGIFVDARSVLVGTATLFLGLIPGLITTGVMLVFRIIEGGAGLPAGILLLVLPLGAGLLWRRFRFKKVSINSKWIWLELLVFGVFVQLVSALAIFALPSASRADVFNELALPIMLLFPIGTLLPGGIFLTRIKERKTLEELEKEKELFKTTLLSVGDGVISTDEDGRIQVINEVASRLTGWTQEEAYNHPFEEVFTLVYESTGQPCESTVKQALENGRTSVLCEKTQLLSRSGDSCPITDSTAPIKGSDGVTQGAVVVFRDITEELRFNQTIEYMSYHDQLTGLYNRRYLEFVVPQLDQSDHYPLAIVMADINGLKLTNDAFGHTCGDNLLIKAAEVIKNACRSNDIVIRHGGDEFLLLLPRARIEHVEKIVNRICYESERVMVSNMNLSISFGWQVKTSVDESFEALFKKAEDQMYRNKLFESPLTREKIIRSIQNTLYAEYDNEQTHSVNVGNLCYKLAQAAGMPKTECTGIKNAGVYHDIGKIAVSPGVLNSKGVLADADWVDIKRHCETGYRILSSVNDMSYLAEYVLAHHERWDGKGYPKGLKENEIPFQSRIIAISETYDAMTNMAINQAPIDPDEAAKEIRLSAGSQFDPFLAKLFVEQVLNKQWAVGIK